MATSRNTLLSNMRVAGVPMKDAHWYHAVARPRDFSGAGDVVRARRILQDFYRRMRETRDSQTTTANQVA